MLIEVKQPSVTCVCVTKNRHSYLIRSIDMFRKQTYENKKMLIVCDHDDIESISIAKNSGIECHVLSAHAKATLGEIRSIAKSLLTTDYFCQWDDDDWFHCDRIKMQMEQLDTYGQTGCVLTNWIIYDEFTGKSYLSMHRLWEGSAIYSVEKAKAIRFPHQGLGEDTVFLNEYINKSGIFPITAPYLYIYRIHSENTWGSKNGHFKMMLAQSQLLPDDVCESIKSLIDSPLHYGELCKMLMHKDTLSKFHFFRFNNLNYTNKELIDYMVKVDDFDEDGFTKRCIK